MRQYGSNQHAELVQAAMTEELRLQQPQPDLLAAKQVGFSEVPFSCCDPTRPDWCRQAHVTEPASHYSPPANLTLHRAGCSGRVPALFGWYLWSAGRAALAAAGLHLLTALLARMWQTSSDSALEAGRHLSPAPGWLLPVCWGRRETAEERQPLLAGDGDGPTSEEDTDTANTEATEEQETGDEEDETDGGDGGDDDTDDTGDVDDSSDDE